MSQGFASVSCDITLDTTKGKNTIKTGFEFNFFILQRFSSNHKICMFSQNYNIQKPVCWDVQSCVTSSGSIIIAGLQPGFTRPFIPYEYSSHIWRILWAMISESADWSNVNFAAKHLLFKESAMSSGHSLGRVMCAVVRLRIIGQ